ncbi:MAG: hypothetical protein NVS3B16_24890 [Vulcanimicrobiaceae bacterium]
MSLKESVTRVVDGAKDAMEHLHAANGRPAPDALAIIKADHERVSALFKTVLSGDGGSMAKARKTIDEIVHELEMHAKMEETLFYPALRARTKASGDDRQTVLEAVEEHGSIKDLLKKIKRSSGRDETLKAKVQVLSEIVEHHVHEEEQEMFGEAHRLLGEKRLADLGVAMAKFKSKASGGSGSKAGKKSPPRTSPAKLKSRSAG